MRKNYVSKQTNLEGKARGRDLFTLPWFLGNQLICYILSCYGLSVNISGQQMHTMLGRGVATLKHSEEQRHLKHTTFGWGIEALKHSGEQRHLNIHTYVWQGSMHLNIQSRGISTYNICKGGGQGNVWKGDETVYFVHRL